MPKKIRVLKAELRREGFVARSAKGSHTVWEHPLLPENPVTIAGNDGSDADPYLEKQVRQAIRKLKEKQGE